MAQIDWKGTFQEDLIELLRDRRVDERVIDLVQDFCSLRARELRFDAKFSMIPEIEKDFVRAEMYQRRVGTQRLASLLEDLVKQRVVKDDSRRETTVHYSIGLLVDFS